MKRYILLIAVCVLFLITIVAQNPKSDKAQKPKNSPKEDIKVNREYDEKGNLIKFDSTYSYSFSSDTTLQDFDFKDFTHSFGMNFDFFNDSAFSQSFLKDFDPFIFNGLNQNHDSLLNQLNKMHHYHFRNDSTMHSMKNFEEFFKQFEGFNSDSNSMVNPFMYEFNFDSKDMKEMMEQMQKQMEQMHSHQQKLLKN